MPRRERTTEVVVTRKGAITAAAVRYRGGSSPAKKVKKAPTWHEQAWMYYNTIGEFRYACNWVGNLLSRATLSVYKDGKPTTDKVAVEIMQGLYGGPEGQREMLRALGINLTVGGDAWVIGEDQGDGDRWEVAASANVREASDGSFMVGKREIPDPLAVRIWRSHPAKYDEVDSPAQAVLMILDEIAGLTAGVKAQIQSRLAGAGILPIPSEISFGSIRSTTPAQDEAEAMAQSVVKDIDALLVELAETMMEAIEDPSSPVARVPILLQIPGEYVDKLKLVTFWTPLDENTKTLRDEAIRRLALGMDMPPEVLTGSGELNHWNAWQIEEASIKSHTEPLLQIITTSLATGFLRPALEDTGMAAEEARRYSIHADTSEIRLRPNRSREAIELYEHGVLSEEAMLRENGFKPEDKMDDKERTDFFTRKVAGGSTTPELVAWALNILGVPVPVNPSQVIPTEERPQPSIAEHPEREIPDERDVSAAEPMVFRALERAGARLRSKYKDALVSGSESVHNADLYRFTRMTPIMVDEVLVDAWDDLSRFRIRISPVLLDDYTRHLFRTGDTFNPDGFRDFVRRHA